jgi:hypothetical protein
MDYSQYAKNAKFYSGSEEKIGITIGSRDYILKFQKSSETGMLNNTICEYIGCHIFQMLGMPVQNTFLGTYAGREVVLLEDFVKENQKFVPFNEVGESSLEYDRDTYQYSYSDIMKMLEENTKLTRIPEYPKQSISFGVFISSMPCWGILIGMAQTGDSSRRITVTRLLLFSITDPVFFLEYILMRLVWK